MLSPYFQSLARQKRICPECLAGKLRIESTAIPRPDMAIERCDACGYFHMIEAPAAAVAASQPSRGRIIHIDFNKR